MKREPKSYYETQEGLNYLTSLYRDRMMTDEEVAKEIGYSRRTIYNWRNSSKQIDGAIRLGKQYVDTQVENKLLNVALKGNITAIIFWLKNRKPKKWRDVQKLDLETTINSPDIKKYKEFLKEDESEE